MYYNIILSGLLFSAFFPGYAFANYFNYRKIEDFVYKKYSNFCLDYNKKFWIEMEKILDDKTLYKIENHFKALRNKNDL